MTLPEPSQIREALHARERLEIPALPGRTNHLPAGILVPLRWLAGDVEVILTERSAHLQTHPGEISFPGGRPESSDVDIEATALREAREEIGLEHAEVLGPLSTIPLYTSDYRLHPFVARIASDVVLRRQPSEVASLVTFRVRALLDSAHHGIPWEGGGVRHVSPVFETETKLVFGGTAHALWEFLAVAAPLFGTELPELVTGKYEWSDLI